MVNHLEWIANNYSSIDNLSSSVMQPATGHLELIIDAEQNGAAQIEILDMDGALLSNNKINIVGVQIFKTWMLMH